MKAFKIPALVMPTEDELQASSAKWLARTGPCLIDNWPKELLALSAPTTFIDIPPDLVRMFDEGGPSRLGAKLADDIDRITGWERHFFRLNSRSPKDALWPFEACVSCSGKEMLNVMACSERILDDLVWFSHSAAVPKLCLRQFWPSVRPCFEFRCFIKDGDLLAVAEYANDGTQLWETPTPERDLEIRARIAQYLNAEVKPRLHIQTVVVDLFLTPNEAKLIEINPYGMSDPVGAVSYEAIERGIPSIARLPRALASAPACEAVE